MHEQKSASDMIQSICIMNREYGYYAMGRSLSFISKCHMMGVTTLKRTVFAKNMMLTNTASIFTKHRNELPFLPRCSA